MNGLLQQILTWFFESFPGWKAYMAGIGLVGLGVYQLSTGLYTEGITSIAAGLGLMTEARRA